jgi:cyclopropane fatty-acyl-phospholipid synthase-like methyltransferase
MKKQQAPIKNFWNKEYSEGEEGEHFILSDKPGKDFLKFVAWLEKMDGKGAINKETVWLDVGCGNGRHGLYLYENFGAGGLGYDLSQEAIAQANKKAAEIKLSKRIGADANFGVLNINSPIPAPNESVDIIIDAMASHVLTEAEHKTFLEECDRVLNYKGYIFLKTFLRDEDDYANDLIKKFPGPDAGSYIHPKIGIYERALYEKEILALYEKYFKVEKVERSHFHREKGKRRYIVVYLRKV